MRAGQQLEAFSTTFGLVASLLFHGLAFGYVASRTANFDFDFDLTLPTEVEFGLTDAMDGVQVASAPSGGTFGTATESPPDGASGDARESSNPEERERLRRAEEAKARAEERRRKEREKAEEKRRRKAQRGDAEELPVGPSTLAGPSRIPPGAQLALRIDIRRIRRSPLGPDVTNFLASVPDWQLLLDGSGIDPVQDLDRLLIASPNLQRSKLVLAGRHGRDAEFVDRSVRQMASARGRRAPWKERYGVRTAPWHNRDATKRILATLSTSHFTITRPQDLQPVLALAKARELRDPKNEGLIAARGPDALLSMGPEEAISLEIEGVHRFVRGNVRHVPVRLRVAVQETGPNEATVTALATYASSPDALQAAKYWKDVAEFYSQQLFVSLAGFGKTLRRLELKPDGERIEVRFKLNADQIRFILSYLEGRLQARGGRPSKRPPSRPASPSGNSASPTKKAP
ncbi:MAG: hypothetical protein AAF997_20745 [Myxococcota bacterium]